MIYRLHIATPLPGKLEVYLLRSKIGIELQESHGAKMIGQWQPTTGSLKRVYTLWGYESYAAWERCRKAMCKDGDGEAFTRLEQEEPCAGETEVIFLEPTPRSPLD